MTNPETTDVRERVARAICKAGGEDPDAPWTAMLDDGRIAGGFHWQHRLIYADAAIEEINK